MRFGSYVINRKIGAGAHGTVFQAHHALRPDELIALKVIPSRGQLDRLMLEPTLLSRLKHPNIIKLHEYFICEEQLILVLDYIDGVDLQTHLSEHGPFSYSQARHFLIQMASALAHAHEHNILHRDFKLSNVLIRHRSEVSIDSADYVLVDFGVSKMGTPIQFTQKKGGTKQFMSPEQLRGRPTQQSDLWALGVAAYALLKGTLPFQGNTFEELAHAIFYETPISLEPHDNEGAQELNDIVMSLLEKPLGRRIASARELLSRLGASELSSVEPFHAAVVTRENAPKQRHWPWVGRFLLSIPGTLFSNSPFFNSLDMALDVVGENEKPDNNRIRLRRRLLLAPILCTVCALFYIIGSSKTWLHALIISGATAAGTFLMYRGHRHVMPSANEKDWLKVAIIIFALGTIGPIWIAKNYPSLVNEWNPIRRYEKSSSNIAELIRDESNFKEEKELTLFPQLINYANLVLFCVFIRRFYILRRLNFLLMLIDKFNGQQDQLLKHFKEFLNFYPRDWIILNRYLDLLVSIGDYKEIVVQARIALLLDPYNMEFNFLLAQAYYYLQLYQDCYVVCNAYLTVSGQCFEFEELKGRSQKMIEWQK